ncbi:hypothetical protein BHM03_00041390 [Ensete ventricosum]|nr:hypothetical protein BHM03_00041390 [Ensete ventricosum]
MRYCYVFAAKAARKEGGWPQPDPLQGRLATARPPTSGRLATAKASPRATPAGISVARKGCRLSPAGVMLTRGQSVEGRHPWRCRSRERSRS